MSFHIIATAFVILAGYHTYLFIEVKILKRAETSQGEVETRSNYEVLCEHDIKIFENETVTSI